MPVSFPAHQFLALPLIRSRPGLVDGVALVVGSAMPDLAYVLGQWMNRQSHTLIGLVVWGVPATFVTARLIRWRVAEGVLRQLPDTSLGLRGWAAIACRRPSAASTGISALIGVGSHIQLDGFTHTGRWGANALGWNDVLFTAPIRGAFTGAAVAQYLGHSLGSLITVAVFVVMAREGWPSRRYGADAVAAARSRTAVVTTPERLLFWGAMAGVLVPVWVMALLLGRSLLFWSVTMTWVALLVAGSVRVPRRWIGGAPEPAAPGWHRSGDGGSRTRRGALGPRGRPGGLGRRAG